MRIWTLSDLHLETQELRERLVAPDADICVVAGDLTNGVANGVAWLGRNIAPHMPVIYVPGNHEFYYALINCEIAAGRAAVEKTSNVFLLHDQAMTFRGIRFIGATLWTDFEVNGRESALWDMQYARHLVNDYKTIWTGAAEDGTLLTPEVSRRMHVESCKFIDRTLSESAEWNRKTVVVTHHAPHRGSIHPRYKSQSMNSAFVSDLSELIDKHQPALWIHGHVHDSHDYVARKTRIICNPRGYGTENFGFDPGLVIEI